MHRCQIFAYVVAKKTEIEAGIGQLNFFESLEGIIIIIIDNIQNLTQKMSYSSSWWIRNDL